MEDWVKRRQIEGAKFMFNNLMFYLTIPYTFHTAVLNVTHVSQFTDLNTS